jgi:hypothetical protein
MARARTQAPSPTRCSRGPVFAAGNAALWTSAPLPEGLDLSALPQGGAPPHAGVGVVPARDVRCRAHQPRLGDGRDGTPARPPPRTPVAYRRAYDRLRRGRAQLRHCRRARRLDAGHTPLPRCRRNGGSTRRCSKGSSPWGRARRRGTDRGRVERHASGLRIAAGPSPVARQLARWRRGATRPRAPARSGGGVLDQRLGTDDGAGAR